MDFVQETSIELVIIDDDGVVQSICEQPVFGTIKDLAVLPWNKRFHARSPQVGFAHWLEQIPFKKMFLIFLFFLTTYCKLSEQISKFN